MSLQSVRDMKQMRQDASTMTADDRRVGSNTADEIFMRQQEFLHSTSP